MVEFGLMVVRLGPHKVDFASIWGELSLNDPNFLAKVGGGGGIFCWSNSFSRIGASPRKMLTEQNLRWDLVTQSWTGKFREPRPNPVPKRARIGRSRPESFDFAATQAIIARHRRKLPQHWSNSPEFGPEWVQVTRTTHDILAVICAGSNKAGCASTKVRVVRPGQFGPERDFSLKACEPPKCRKRVPTP